MIVSFLNNTFQNEGNYVSTNHHGFYKTMHMHFALPYGNFAKELTTTVVTDCIFFGTREVAISITSRFTQQWIIQILQKI